MNATANTPKTAFQTTADRALALGISYALTRTAPPALFFAVITAEGLGHHFVDACFETADAIEDQGEEAVLEYLEAYALVMTGVDPEALVVRYHPEG